MFQKNKTKYIPLEGRWVWNLCSEHVCFFHGWCQQVPLSHFPKLRVICLYYWLPAERTISKEHVYTFCNHITNIQQLANPTVGHWEPELEIAVPLCLSFSDALTNNTLLLARTTANHRKSTSKSLLARWILHVPIIDGHLVNKAHVDLSK